MYICKWQFHFKCECLHPIGALQIVPFNHFLSQYVLYHNYYEKQSPTIWKIVHQGPWLTKGKWKLCVLYGNQFGNKFGIRLIWYFLVMLDGWWHIYSTSQTQTHAILVWKRFLGCFTHHPEKEVLRVFHSPSLTWANIHLGVKQTIIADATSWQSENICICHIKWMITRSAHIVILGSLLDMTEFRWWFPEGTQRCM